MIEVSREKLEKILKECLEMARPYTGEEWMGKADLANELLGNPPINWNEFIDEQNRVYRENWEKLRAKRLTKGEGINYIRSALDAWEKEEK